MRQPYYKQRGARRGGRLAQRALSLAVAGLLALSPALTMEAEAASDEVSAATLGIYGGGGGGGAGSSGDGGGGGGAGYLQLNGTWRFGTPGTGGTVSQGDVPGLDGTANNGGTGGRGGGGGTGGLGTPPPEDTEEITHANTEDGARGGNSGGSGGAGGGASYGPASALVLTGSLTIIGGNGGQASAYSGGAGGNASLTVASTLHAKAGATLTLRKGDDGTKQAEWSSGTPGSGGSATATLSTLKVSGNVTMDLSEGVTFNGGSTGSYVTIHKLDIDAGKLTVNQDVNMNGKDIHLTASNNGIVLEATGGKHLSGTVTLTSAVDGILWTTDNGKRVTTNISDTDKTLDLTGATSLSATTATTTHTITAQAGPGGSISPSGAVEVNANGSQRFTITPNSGYGVQTVLVDGVSVVAVTSYTFSAVTEAHTISATFAPLQTGGDNGNGSNDREEREAPSVSATDKVVDNIKDAKPGDTVKVTPDASGLLPGKVLDALAGKDVTLEVKSGDVTWVISGKDLPAGKDFSSLDLRVNTKASTIPVAVINNVTGQSKVMQLSLSHNGPFGFALTLRLPAGKENAGRWANLYYYDPTAEALEFRAAAKIGADGNADLPFDHASDYAVVIDTEDLTPKAPVEPTPLPFSDVAEGAWYYDAVRFAYENGLFSGVTETDFAPDAPMTRAMLWTVLARQSGADVSGGSPWHENARLWAVAQGLTDGSDPEGAVTREQLVTTLHRRAGSPAGSGDLSVFSDASSVSGWAADATAWAVGLGILQGEGGALNPQGQATRAQVAAMLQRGQ